MKQELEEWKEENIDLIIESYKDGIEGLCDVPEGFIECLHDQYLEDDEEEEE